MRTPARLRRDLGPAGFLTFQLVVGGAVLAALIHPLFLVPHLIEMFRETSVNDSILHAILRRISQMALLGGYLASAVLGLTGLARRKLLRSAWALALIPLHWVLLSFAAWRALYQLVRDPYQWDKTEHGLARTSRLRGNTE